LRKLDYRDKWTKPKTAIEQAKVIGGYNAFTAKRAAKLFKSKGVKAVQMGRESSVVAYVATKTPDKTMKLAKKVGAEEYTIATGRGKYHGSYGKTPVVRVWWD
jgi:soluble lytic murein transglycosylase-like protein